MYNGNPFNPGGPVQPPDFSALKEKTKKFMKNSFGIILTIVVLAVVVFNSLYMLKSSENAVITRFGRFAYTESNAGLKLKIPFVDKVQKVNAELVRSLEFGYRTNDANNATYQAEEAHIITSDLNIVIADWAVLYQVTDVYKYLFSADDPIGTLRIISESAYRRVVASHSLDDILTDQKDIIQTEVRTDLQAICDKYSLGITIRAVQLQDAMPPDEVNESFQDVTRAKEEKESKINEASKYENEKLPVARGEAERLKNDAEAYKQKRVNEAKGAVARYKSIEAEYAKQPAIMRTRLYIEMIRDVLPKVKDVFIVDDSSGDTVKFLPIGGSAVIPAK